MFLLQCDGCKTTAVVACTCPPEMADLPMHVPACAMADPGGALECAPGSGCCAGDDHPGVSHDAAANACAGGHGGEACPHDTCRMWEGMKAAVADLNPDHPAHAALAAQLAHVDGDCPGGHCGPGVQGCTVCRPMTIQIFGGETVARPALGGAR